MTRVVRRLTILVIVERGRKRLMGNGTYSQMDHIPTGQASDRLTEGCLVLEGGAFRGLYTQGVIDTLMLLDINLASVIGVSAGALAGMGYVSGQIGRAARINIGYRHDDRYIGLRAFLQSHSILDVGFLTEDRGILEPFDYERFNDPRRRFVAVATNCITAEPTYFERDTCADIALAVRASATMPYMSPMVMIDGVPYLDGACSCRIPYQWALDQGYEKVVVIRTRDAAYRKEVKDVPMAHLRYGAYPRLVESLEGASVRYNEQCEEIERLHAEGRIFRFAPSEPVSIDNIEDDVEKLGDLYWLGVYDCFQNVDALRAYLNA
jgi:predicted patatin/cPLA2 family phospholipase